MKTAEKYSPVELVALLRLEKEKQKTLEQAQILQILINMTETTRLEFAKVDLEKAIMQLEMTKIMQSMEAGEVQQKIPETTTPRQKEAIETTAKEIKPQPAEKPKTEKEEVSTETTEKPPEVAPPAENSQAVEAPKETGGTQPAQTGGNTQSQT